MKVPNSPFIQIAFQIHIAPNTFLGWGNNWTNLKHLKTSEILNIFKDWQKNPKTNRTKQQNPSPKPGNGIE